MALSEKDFLVLRRKVTGEFQEGNVIGYKKLRRKFPDLSIRQAIMIVEYAREKSGKTFNREQQRMYEKAAPEFRGRKSDDEETKVEKQKNREIERIFGDHEDFCNYVVRGIKNAVSNYVYDEPFKKNISVHAHRSTSLVVNFGDWHTGEIVNPNETEGIGYYNKEIQEDYILKLIEHTKVLANIHKPKRMYLNLLGDFVSGIIHDELMMFGDVMTPFQQAFQCANYIAQYVESVYDMFSSIRINTVVGNHGRMTKKPQFKHAYYSLDYITYQLASMLLVNFDKLDWNINLGFSTIENIDGANFYLLHGDSIRSQLGIPFYGLVRTNKNKVEISNAHGKKLDGMIIGHFHTASRLDGFSSTIYMNGCLPGITELGLKKGYLSRPSQLFLVMREGEVCEESVKYLRRSEDIIPPEDLKTDVWGKYIK